MYFALFYDYVEDILERRGPYREDHLEHAQSAAKRGELVLAGAFSDVPDGAVFAFRAATQSAVEEFAKSDPYVRNGLVTSWKVRPWNVVVGSAHEA